MNPVRIVELLKPFLMFDGKPFALSLEQLNDISTYIDILSRWNTRINLSAIRDPEEIVSRHFGESFFAAGHLFPNAPRSSLSQASGIQVGDLGSGTGFPGIPIKLWDPNIALTLIESNHKKAVFLREVVRTLVLRNATVKNTRAETLGGCRFDVVTLRAVEKFTRALPIAARLLAASGHLALLISFSQLHAARSALPKFCWDDPIPIPQSKSRLLLVGQLEPM